MKPLRMAGSLLAMSLAAACGGDGGKTCGDVANAITACAAQLGATADTNAIAQSCENSSCTGSKQRAIDCVAAAQCGTTVTGYETSVNGCLTAEGCPTVTF